MWRMQIKKEPVIDSTISAQPTKQRKKHPGIVKVAERDIREQEIGRAHV